MDVSGVSASVVNAASPASNSDRISSNEPEKTPEIDEKTETTPREAVPNPSANAGQIVDILV